MHYIVNNACTAAAATATWPLDSNTTFLMPALAAAPAQAIGMFAAGPFPAAKGTFPLAPDAACLSACQLPSAG